jgi:hypothetical protein
MDSKHEPGKNLGGRGVQGKFMGWRVSKIFKNVYSRFVEILRVSHKV